MDAAVTIHLIRHAPTAGNLLKQYIGWTNEPIEDTNVFIPISNDVEMVIGSDLIRCEQTARGYFPMANFQALPAFREMHFGDFECKSYEDLKGLSMYRDWIDRPFDEQPPNGESFVQFEQRVLNEFRSVTWNNLQYFVLHGGVIRLLLFHFAPEQKAFWEWQVPHHMCFSLTWSHVEQLKEGQRCTSLSVDPIMVRDNL